MRTATAPPASAASEAASAAANLPAFAAWWRCLLIGPAQASVVVLTLAMIALAEMGLRAMGIQTLTTILATIVATMIASGSLQLGAWLIGIALGRGAANALRLAYFQTLLIGLGVTGVIALLSLLCGRLLNLEPHATLVFTAIIVVLTPLLLAVGELMLLQRRAQTIGTLAVAAGGAWTATLAYAAPPLVTVSSFTLIATIALVVQAEFEIRRRSWAMGKRLRRLPPPSLIWLHAAPFVWYGILTVTLVFAGQPALWLSDDILSRGYLYLIHLAGLSLFILSQGAFEAAMALLWFIGTTVQHQFTLPQDSLAGRSIQNFILAAKRRAVLVQVLLASVIGPLIFWWLASRTDGVSWGSIGLTLAGSMVSYALLGHALFLCGVLNVFGNRWRVVKALLLTVIVTGTIAQLALVYLGPLASVAGIGIGSLLLYRLVVGELRRLLHDSAYTLYRSFS
ncbi:MAG: hypothetical protein SNJ69_05500 [Chloroflexaceae bacterium]